MCDALAAYLSAILRRRLPSFSHPVLLYTDRGDKDQKLHDGRVGNIIGVGPNSPRRSGRNLPVGAVFVKLLAASDPVLASSVDPKSITEIAVIKSIKSHSLQS